MDQQKEKVPLSNTWVIDIETDSLNAKVIWCVVLENLYADDVRVFFDDASLREFLDTEKPDVLIGHNIIGFDWPTLQRLWELKHKPKLIDTLVLSRLMNQRIPGGHSLDVWGQRMGFHKISFHDFSKYTPEMLEYCKRDVAIAKKLYFRLMKVLDKPEWTSAINVEHSIAQICQDMHRNGFPFNVETAIALHDKAVIEVNKLEEEMDRCFPPYDTLDKMVYVKLKKDGTPSKVGLTPEEYEKALKGEMSFARMKTVYFDPASPKQRIEVLNKAGWKPTDKTDAHRRALKERDKDKLEHFKVYGWKVNEVNLSTLPEDAPEGARKLVEWMLVDNRRRLLRDWIKLYNPTTGAIHGWFNGIGCWSQRMSHSNPNMANVPSTVGKYKSEYLKGLTKEWGVALRSLWTKGKGTYIVGTDAEGIQLRVLAHYMNDQSFTEALVSGDKDLGTDAHTLNAFNLGFSDPKKYRPVAKTFIYAWLLGAGTAKVAEILGCTNKEAEAKVYKFIQAYPGLLTLKTKTIPNDAYRGFFEGLDGRKVTQDSEHLMLAGYLQNGESVIMKHANHLWRTQLEKLQIRYTQVNFVHDEWCTIVYGSEEEAREVGRIQCEAIEQVGVNLNLNCPLAGSTAIGENWYDVH